MFISSLGDYTSCWLTSEQRVDEANEALQAGNNAELCGRRLRVEKAKVNRTLFIAKMSKNLTNQVRSRIPSDIDGFARRLFSMIVNT
jgi:hypothetical protein